MLQRSLDRARARRSDEGFTLIELLIVIIILGILAAIVVFSVTGITDKGQKSACKTSVETIDTAYEAYAASLADPSTADPTTTTVESLSPKWLHAGVDGTKIGSLTIGASTKVSDVDTAGASC